MDLVCFWSVKDIKIETSVRLQMRCCQLDQLLVDLRCTGQPQSILFLDKLSDRWSSRSKRPPCVTNGTFGFVTTSTCSSVCYYSQASLCLPFHLPLGRAGQDSWTARYSYCAQDFQSHPAPRSTAVMSFMQQGLVYNHLWVLSPSARNFFRRG